jgi:hypothetical protein
MLDIVLTTNATLVKSSTNIPGLADHDIIITDTIIKPTYNKNKPEKRYLYSKTNWDKIDNEIAKICVEIDQMENDQIDINTIWETFKRKLKAAIDENIPLKIFKRNNNLSWMTKNFRRMVRRKVRLHRAARKSKHWTEYKEHKKECKRQFLKAETQYVNNIITEGLEKNDRKPFWRYGMPRPKNKTI